MDIEVASLISGYAGGYFLMSDEDGSLSWYTTRKRALIPLDERFHISRSLQRKLRAKQFKFAINQAFMEVVDGCAARAETWISAEMKQVYNQLNQAGYAHTFETYTAQGTLAGGILGITLGSVFIGESMFHATTDGSKAAMAGLVMHLRFCGFTILDAQIQNPFLSTFGCYEMETGAFMHTFSREIQRKPTSLFTSLASGADFAAAVAVSLRPPMPLA